MSTTQDTTSTGSSQLQFNPIAQGIYNQLISGGGNVLSGYMNSPFSNPYFNMSAAQSQKGAQQASANNMAALQQNMRTSGLGGQAGAGFKQAQLARTGRAGQAMSSQANVANYLSAMQRQMAAAGTGMSFSPQLTGSTTKSNQTTKTGGLGTWLPQLLSGGLGAGIAGMSGGMGGDMGFMTGGAPSASPFLTGMVSPDMLGPGTSGPTMGNIFQNMSPSIPSFNPLAMAAMGGGAY